LKILEWDKETNKPKDLGETVGVQFNPQTLKVSYANQLSGGDKNGAASRQFVGRGTRQNFHLTFGLMLQYHQKKI